MVVGLNPTQKKKENVHKGDKGQKGTLETLLDTETQTVETRGELV